MVEGKLPGAKYRDLMNDPKTKEELRDKWAGWQVI